MQLNDDQIDALTEVINIGAGRAASSLSELIGERIVLSVPSIVASNSESLSNHVEHGTEDIDIAITQDFEGTVSGRALLAFPRSSGIKLGKILGGVDDSIDELDFDLSGILEEVGNIVLNGVLGSLSNLLATHLTYRVPQLSSDSSVPELVDRYSTGGQETEKQVLLADARFEVASRRISGSLVLAFSLGSIEEILKSTMVET